MLSSTFIVPSVNFCKLYTPIQQWFNLLTVGYCLLQVESPCLDEDHHRKTVYTIERLPEVAAKELHCSTPGHHLRKSKVATLAAALLLGTLIVLLTTAALVYTLRTGP